MFCYFDLVVLTYKRNMMIRSIIRGETSNSCGRRVQHLIWRREMAYLVLKKINIYISSGNRSTILNFLQDTINIIFIIFIFIRIISITMKLINSRKLQTLVLVVCIHREPLYTPAKHGFFRPIKYLLFDNKPLSVYDKANKNRMIVRRKKKFVDFRGLSWTFVDFRGLSATFVYFRTLYELMAESRRK
ncbi:hypothetical protein BDA99DRAFT_544496 [Phascolomyces articulosus]|uniref:Uncharacterized protein n=1 Tax=Phascolomyces articulosus TaxID=60185 RepID=A0AAD5JK19_9FUNG|nr:hypothetical protein BDA99DRAFT_544496 [Phascolomyces articulosus]